MKDRTTAPLDCAPSKWLELCPPTPLHQHVVTAGPASRQVTDGEQATSISITPQAPLSKAQPQAVTTPGSHQHGPAHQTCSIPVAPLRPAAAEIPVRPDLPGLSICCHIPATLIQPVWQVTARADYGSSQGCTHVSAHVKAQATAP